MQLTVLQTEIVTRCPLLPRKTDPPSLLITGEVHLRLLYKYDVEWEPVYLGATAYENGEFKQAVNLFTEALRNLPDNFMLYSFRSAARTDLYQFEAAHADAERVIELQPNRAEGYMRLGNVFMAADDFAKAKDAFMTALKLGMQFVCFLRCAVFDSSQ